MPRKTYRMCSVRTFVTSFQRVLATRYLTKPGDPHAHYWFPKRKDAAGVSTEAYAALWRAKNHLKG